MSSSCFGSLDIRSPGVFTETFLDHYHLDICKSNAKTHKIISINRFGITCCYFSSGNIPAIALFAATFLSNLVLSQSNQCFGCGLDQSHCRKLHIQIWLWPGLSENSFSWVLFVSSYTTAIFSPQLPGLLTRNEETTDESKNVSYAIGKSSSICAEKINFVSDGLQCMVNNRKFKMQRWRESKKSNSLTRQNNNFARVLRFFVHFLAVTTRLPRENA